jgi:copper chaperone CopZ
MAKSKIEMSVEGMTGDGVCRCIETGLSEITGVEYVHVNLGAAKVMVKFDDAIATADQLMSTVERLGFHVSQI